MNPTLLTLAAVLMSVVWLVGVAIDTIEAEYALRDVCLL